MTHSLISPSNAAQRVQCPASVKLQAQFPEPPPTQDTLDGDAVHWAGAEQLRGRLTDVGERAPNGVYLTLEMQQAADLYYDYVFKVMAAHGLKPSDGKIETPVAIPRVHPLAFGTPDYHAWLPTQPRPTLFLADLKYGHGFVEVFENWQLVEYAAGVTHGIRLPDTEVDVLATIVQPRSYHRDGPTREWRFRLSDIRAQVNISSHAAYEALGESPAARVGSECKHCTARHACMTLQRSSYNAVDEAGKPQVAVLNGPALGLEIRILRAAKAALEAKLSGLEEQALSSITSGALVQGLAVERGEGRRRWKVPAEHVINAARMLNIDVAKPVEALTPRQALEKGLAAVVVDAMAERPKSEAKLVLDDGSLARRVFG